MNFLSICMSPLTSEVQYFYSYHLWVLISLCLHTKRCPMYQTLLTPLIIDLYHLLGLPQIELQIDICLSVYYSCPSIRMERVDLAGFLNNGWPGTDIFPKNSAQCQTRPHARRHKHKHTRARTQPHTHACIVRVVSDVGGPLNKLRSSGG